MSKKNKKMIWLIVAAVALAALIGVYFLVMNRAAAYTASQTESYDSLITLTADQIDKISYDSFSYGYQTDASAASDTASDTASTASTSSTASDASDSSAGVKKVVMDQTSLGFTRTDGTWAMDDDATFSLNQDTVNTLVSGVTGVSIYQTMSDVTDISQYGLDYPTYVVTVTDKDGNATKITIGNVNSATEDAYVYLNDDTSKVYSVASSIQTNFKKTKDDFKTEESTASTTDSASASSASTTDSASASSASTADSASASSVSTADSVSESSTSTAS